MTADMRMVLLNIGSLFAIPEPCLELIAMRYVGLGLNGQAENANLSYLDVLARPVS